MGDPTRSIRRWAVEQIEAIAPSPASMSAARPIATPGRWQRTGFDESALWGSFHGGGAEPYDTMVDHLDSRFDCTCPSRQRPCKHALALLLLWVNDQVAGPIAGDGVPPNVATWRARHHPSPRDSGLPGPSGVSDAHAAQETPDQAVTPDAGEVADHSDTDRSVSDHERTQGRDDRVASMHQGLDELDRWLVDRIRTGLTDPSLAQYATWDALAARLVDARARSLANRIRRLSGVVGASPDWHERVLEEIGLLHLLAEAGRRLGALPDPLADVVATTIGWQARQADVLAGVPETDDWIVAGRSDTREDRIEVRRHWLRGTTTNRWALVLSFAAYRQSLDTSLVVGSSLRADIHRYPGNALRSIIGDRFGDPVAPQCPATSTIADACAAVGSTLADEPWLDRLPATVLAAPTRVAGRWLLTDATGALPLAVDDDHEPFGLDIMLAVSAGDAVPVTVEWTPRGCIPLSLHLADGAVDIGPRADASFVSAA